MFSKDLLKMKMCGDWFFWVKLSEKTNIVFVSEPLNYFRNHGAISRTHNTLSKKKERLLEEGKIRCYIYKKLKSFNKAKDKKLLNNWFKLHPISSILSKGFYKMDLPRINNFSLLLKFLSFKLKK